MGGVILKSLSAVAKSQVIRRQFNIPLGATVLLSVGEVNENKNHCVVIEALAKLEATDVHYIICGRGELEESHKALAKQLGLEGRVHLTGYRNDVADFYQAADVFVFPSLREGLGLAALEAMYCGLPVIAARNRGTVEYMKEGSNGFMCDACDADQFAEAIRQLIRDKASISEYGRESQTISKNFSVDSIIAFMNEIYNSTITKG